MYKHELPKSFHGKTYEEVAHLCFMNPHLHIMLIAIDATPEKHNAEPLIFPAPFGFKIEKGMYGYFIAQDKEEVSALDNMGSPDNFTLRAENHFADGQESQAIPLNEITIDLVSGDQENSSKLGVQKPKLKGVSSIYYKMTEERTFEEALIEEPRNFMDHIILCTFSEKDSDELNLQSFVSPLRALTLQPNELKPIVIIGNKKCIENEWSSIAEYDNVFVIDGSPLDQDVLKAVNIAQCSSCIILGSTASLDEDPALIDKQPILCSLTFDKATTGRHIHKVTELYKDENVQFLDLEDEDDNAEGFINSQPFAQGECVSSTVFDSLVAVAYFNPGATALFEKLVTGGSVNQAKPRNRKTRRFTLTSSTREQPKPSLYRPRFLQISVPEKFHNRKFTELFESLLEEKKLCIGIYRQMEEKEFKRYVITAPTHNLLLRPTDYIFVMVSYN